MSLIVNAPAFSLYENNASATPSTNSPGATVSNPAGGANTKNTTWTQLIASTAFDAQLIVVELAGSAANATDTSTLIDIGIGAAAAETVIIPDLLAGFIPTPDVGSCRSYIFPLYIPSGSRLSARSASVRTTGSTRVFVKLYGGPRNPEAWWCGSQVTAYGINTADSGAVSVTAGNSGAETASPVSIGTTSADHKCLVVGVQPNSATVTAKAYHFDVGIDTASTTWLRQDDLYLNTSTTETSWPGVTWWPIFAPIPNGTVLVVGGECSGTADAMDFALYGVS